MGIVHSEAKVQLLSNLFLGFKDNLPEDQSQGSPSRTGCCQGGWKYHHFAFSSHLEFGTIEGILKWPLKNVMDQHLRLQSLAYTHFHSLISASEI